MPNVQVESVDSAFENFHPHSMIYGFNGTGKTSLAALSGLRTLHLALPDAGLATLRHANSKKVRIIRIKSILHFLDALEKAQKLMSQIDLLVVDTVTGLQSMAIREVKGRRNFEMNQRKWGAVSSRVIECISETSAFPKDVIYLAQEKRKRTQDDDGNDIDEITSSLQPATREFLSGRVDWVGRIYIDSDDKRKLSFILSDSMEAKDRGNVFPKIITLGSKPPYPQMRERIMHYING